MRRVGAGGVTLWLVLWAGADHAWCQVPCPPGVDQRLCQDELDLQARSNVVQGAGARAMGMGGAFLARADDATAASWNPAGLSYLRLPELSAVWSAWNSFTSREWDSTGTLVVRDERSGSAPDLLALTYPFDLGMVSGAGQFSFQRVISFDGARTIDRSAQVTDVDSSGGFDVLALGTGLHLTRRLRVGATVNHWFNGYSQTIQRMATRERRTRQDTEFHISGWNTHIGVIFSPWDSVNLGAVMKTGFTADVRLVRSRTDVTEPITTTNSYESSDVTLHVPKAMGIGLSWRPRDQITVSCDYTHTDWSAGKIRNFFTLARTVGVQPAPPPNVYPELPYPSRTDFRQLDTEQVRAGIEYVAILDRVKIPLRLGYFTDRQYFRSADGTAPWYDGFTAGTGLIVKSLLLDVAYVHEQGSYLNPDGTGNQIRFRSDRIYVSAIYRRGGVP